MGATKKKENALGDSCGSEVGVAANSACDVCWKCFPRYVFDEN